MEHHLRLAETRGSLQAPNSPVQDRALEFMLLLAQREKQIERLERVKQVALMLPPHRDIETVYKEFPEFFPEDFLQQLAFVRATGEDGTFDPEKVDESKLKWKTEVTEDEDDEISRWIKDREGSVSVADLDGGWR